MFLLFSINIYLFIHFFILVILLTPPRVYIFKFSISYSSLQKNFITLFYLLLFLLLFIFVLFSNPLNLHHKSACFSFPLVILPYKKKSQLYFVSYYFYQYLLLLFIIVYFKPTTSVPIPVFPLIIFLYKKTTLYPVMYHL